MPRPRGFSRKAAARARAGKIKKKAPTYKETTNSLPANRGQARHFTDDLQTDADDECTRWMGGVSHTLLDSEEDSDWLDAGSDSGLSDTTRDTDDDDSDLEELEGDDLVEGLRKQYQLQKELQDLRRPSPYESILHPKTCTEWKRAERKRELGYNGFSARRKREVAQASREKEERDKMMRERSANKTVS